MAAILDDEAAEALFQQTMDALEVSFGYDSLRFQQEAVIRRLLRGQSACCVMSTGAGKSLCFQLPALVLPHLTLVISPLISLMKDQVDGLVKRGIAAAQLDSSLSLEESRKVKDGIRDDAQRQDLSARDRRSTLRFKLGDYLKIARFAKENDVERVLALTATAPPKVAEDTCNAFDIAKEGLFVSPVYRSNLNLRVASATAATKLAKLVPFLKQRTGGPAIIYVTAQAHTHEIADALRSRGLGDVRAYHAGMSNDDRKRVQDAFIARNDVTIVATIAFAMGIDKSNIRQIVHYALPKSVEGYMQEIGRAGRDGKSSDCLLFLAGRFARGNTPSLVSIEAWIEELCEKEVTDGVISSNQYWESRNHDIRPVVLNLLAASLELDFEYFRAVTPIYTTYDFTKEDPRGQIDSDKSAAAAALRAVFFPNRNGKISVDVEAAAAKSKGVTRDELAWKISDWEMRGLLTNMKPSQVRARYLLNKDKSLPKTKADQKTLSKQLYDQMLAKEADEVERIRQVVRLATADKCLARSLSDHFGDAEDAIEGGKCGHCSYCETGKPVDYVQAEPTPVSDHMIQAVLAACGIRTDARLLARIAFGIFSPRTSELKLHGHKVWGSCDTCDFEVLLERFEDECKKVNYKDVPGTTPKKRAAPKASTNPSSRGPPPKRTKI